MGAKFLFNPSTGLLDLTQTQDSIDVALKVAEVFNVVEPAVIGDLVIASSTISDTVEPITDNYYNDIVFGVIIAKPTLGRAQVLVSGKLEGSSYQLSGLTTGKALFVSSTGKLTTTAPATGHLQVCGVALKSNSIYLNVSLSKISRP